MNKLRCSLLLLYYILFFCAPNLSAQTLPLDHTVRHGKLSNGLTYYIQRNTEPKNRATFYLVLKAGSILETDKQLGLAHFAEHMSFNGTKHFPKNALVEYLQKSGIRFGADLNAYTGFDETVYQLPIPTDNPEILKNGLQILRDWAQEATLEETEIDAERGVILEEKRLRSGSQERVQQQSLPVLLNNSRYASRMPIGTEQVLKNFKPEVLRSFYRDWYRPDLEAVIIVGDIEAIKMEESVKRIFSDLKNPAQPKKRESFQISLDGKNKFKAITDPEIPQTSIEIVIKHPETANKTVGDYRSTLLRNVFSGMFSARLNQATKSPAAPFLNLEGGFSRLMGGIDALTISIITRKGEIEKGFKDGWMEVSRIRKHGFTQNELIRVKEQLYAQMELLLKQKDNQSSTSLADQYKLHFLKGEAAPGIVAEYGLVKKFLPGISLDEINEFAKKAIEATDRDILLTAPESEKGNLPTQTALNSWLNQIERAEIIAYREEQGVTQLLSKEPIPGKVIFERKIPELGITEWKLSNGAKVVVKPTDYKKDEVAFMAWSAGGTSLYTDQQFQSASNAAGLIASFGLGTHDAISLPRLLNGKQLSVQPFITDRSEGLRCASTVKDLGVAIELAYLYFTAPRKDTAVFNQIVRNSAQQISGRAKQPEAIFADTIAAVMGNHHPRMTGPTIEKLNAISLDESIKIYKERFADAADFTFFFVGSFQTDSLKNLIEHYIASLPSLGAMEKAKDLGIHIPEGKISRTVTTGKEDKATVKLVFSGNFEYNPENNLALSALQEILQFRLIERLREHEAGVYTPSVQLAKVKFPLNRYSITVNFGCAPGNVERLITATLQEMKLLAEKGISEADLEKFKAEQLRQNELLSRDNAFWLNYLTSQYADGEDPNNFLRLDDAIKKLEVNSLQEAAKRYLNGENCLTFILLPEKPSR